jgi:hypothetical protein
MAIRSGGVGVVLSAGTAVNTNWAITTRHAGRIFEKAVEIPARVGKELIRRFYLWTNHLRDLIE